MILDSKENKKSSQNKSAVSGVDVTSTPTSVAGQQQPQQQQSSQQESAGLKNGSATFNTLQNETIVISKYPYHLNGNNNLKLLLIKIKLINLPQKRFKSEEIIII